MVPVRSESEMPREHRWWHHFFSRKMGMWRSEAYNPKNQQACFVNRIVRYCWLCRKEFHEGENVQAQVNLAVGLPPTLTPLDAPPAPVFTLAPVPPLNGPDAG